MKTACALLGLVAFLTTTTSRAQTFTQSFELQPGWNAVWLEVEATDRAPASVFAGLPLRSVWSWADRVSATDFIQNPGDAGWNRAQWLSYFPEGSPEAVLSNLRAILPQRAYLVRLGGDQPVRWSITGRPIVRTPAWAADAFNLRGFPVDPTAPPTFRSFFRASPAHYDPASDHLEEIFTLSPDGRWTAVAPDARMQRGLAYWVFTRGASDFVAPFHLEMSSGDLLDFDATERRVDFTLNNRLALTKGIRIEHLSSNAPPLLLVQSPLSGSTNLTKPLNIHTQLVNGATSHRLVIALNRAELPSANPTSSLPVLRASLVSVSDGEGTLFYVGARALATPTTDYTGLWLGTATITNVTSVPEAGDPTSSGGVPLAFPLRLLLHVDSSGQVSLLRDVTLLYTSTNATAFTNPTALTLSTRPTRLITDPAILANLSALDVRAGRIAGRRLEAPHFDFSLSSGQFQLPLVGTLAVSNQVSGTLSVSPDWPTNPFLHRYHPDHGRDQAYAITREIRLAFDVPGSVPPGDGDEVLGGTYQETLTGLHKRPLSTAGALLLRRISDLGTLNAP